MPGLKKETKSRERAVMRLDKLSAGDLEYKHTYYLNKKATIKSGEREEVSLARRQVAAEESFGREREPISLLEGTTRDRERGRGGCLVRRHGQETSQHGAREHAAASRRRARGNSAHVCDGHRAELVELWHDYSIA